MGRSVNRVFLLGRLGNDADTKHTPSGACVANFSIATSYRKKDGDGFKEITDWHNIVLWKADRVAEYLKKGTQVYVEGRLQTRHYEDKQGVKKYVTEVVSNELILLGGEQKATIPASRPADDSAFDEEPLPF